MKSITRTGCLALAFALALPCAASADALSDFETARQKWHAAGLKNYSFVYEWAGGVLVAPRCSDAKIRLVVRNGAGSTPVVKRGNGRCRTGTRGEKAIGLDVPRTIDAAFEQIGQALQRPPETRRVLVTYDPVLGIPLKYYMENLALTDNDDGFEISAFSSRE